MILVDAPSNTFIKELPIYFIQCNVFVIVETNTRDHAFILDLTMNTDATLCYCHYRHLHLFQWPGTKTNMFCHIGRVSKLFSHL